VFKLMKAKLLVKTIASGDIISKENLTSNDIKSYKTNKIDAIHEEFKRLNITLIDDNLDVERYAKKKKEVKEVKKSTVQETYELWQQKNTIKEIAALRKLTPQTIGGHLAKLIESGTIAITDVLPADKISALAEAFFGYKEETLNPLKEKYGDEFTWDELKMYKSSLNAG
ncbi:helix-turn-helix domain-containing protein, partial [Flavobacterium psychrophilum]|nr:helix-turn-helix domain-containing protein [Flavobacterium psychrophilum]